MIFDERRKRVSFYANSCCDGDDCCGDDCC